MAIQTLYCTYDILSRNQKEYKMATSEGQDVVKGQGHDHGDHDLLMNGSNGEDVVNGVKITEPSSDKVKFTSNSISQKSIVSSGSRKVHFLLRMGFRSVLRL